MSSPALLPVCTPRPLPTLLPADREVQPPRREPAASCGRLRPLAGLAMGTELVLIVEDDGAVRRLVRDILELAGYQVLTAADGREALRSCQQHSGAIALILTDVTMPRMGGQELSEQVQHLDPGVRILFTSGHAADDMVQRGRAIPRDRFIRKPFSARSLAYKVREVLDERPACCP